MWWWWGLMQVLVWNLADYDGGAWMSASKAGSAAVPGAYSRPAPTLGARLKLRVSLS
jgi:hypothetical protein